MESKIDLEKIIFKYKIIEKSDDKGELFHLIRYAMKEAIRQTLELAAENATLDYDLDEKWESYAFIDKSSILKTIDQVQ